MGDCMIFINALVPDENFNLSRKDLEIEDGIIKQVSDKISYNENEMVVDCENFYIVPGFIDVHTHGCISHDYCDASSDEILEMSKFLLSQGVTSFCPTTMTIEVDGIKAALENINEAKKKQTDGAQIIGVNLEGPFLSHGKAGAQNRNFLLNPDVKLFREFSEICQIKLVTIAPELDNSEEFVKDSSKFCTVSLGHTVANYSQCEKAFSLGASHVTHLFNAMPPLHHRDTSLIHAFLESENATAEIICDGIHLDKSIIKTLFKLKPDNIVVISDSMRLCGLEDGSVGDLGGQEVVMINGAARLSDGTLAGSSATLYSSFLNLLDWGIPIGQALKALTINPAKVIKEEKNIGSIKIGKKADIVILDEKYNIVAVYH